MSCPIPKIIHQIWIGPNPRPQAWLDSWPWLNPTWEYRLWTEENIPPLINQKLYDDFGTAWHGKADVLRYELIYYYGGLYLDADLECLRPLAELFTEWDTRYDALAVYLSEKARPNKLNNAVLGAPARHPLFKQIITELASVKLAGTEHEIARDAHIITGPSFFTKTTQNYPNLLRLPSWTFQPEFHSDIQKYSGSEQPFARHYWYSTHKTKPSHGT